MFLGVGDFVNKMLKKKRETIKVGFICLNYN